MEVIFTHIAISNFKCFLGEPQVLDLDSSGFGLHFLRGVNKVEPRLGSNGSGKSSIWDALTWCLYGKTVDNLRNPDVKPRTGKGSTDVLVRVIVDDTEYNIVRRTNPNKLTINDQVVGQEQIDQLIGMTFEIFIHTVLFGQGKPLFFDLEPRHKMGLFSDVLRLERWEARSALAGERVRSLETRLARLEGEINSGETLISEVERQLETGQAASDEWEEKQAGRIELVQEELDALRPTLEQLELLHCELDPKVDMKEVTLGQLRHDLHELEEEERETARILDKKKMQKEQSESNLRRLEHDLGSKKCPTCGQAIKSDANRKAIQAAIVDEKAKLKRFNIAKAQKAFDTLVKKRKAQLKEVTDLDAEIEEINDKLGRVNLDLSRAKERRNSLLKEIEGHEEAANPYAEQIREGKKLLKKTQASIREASAEIKKVNRMIERAKFWVKGFKDVRLFIIDEVLQDLELNTNAALEDVGLIGWEIKFDVERETKSGTTSRGLNVSILGPGMKDPVKWESWSGGEGQRLRLVGALALSDTLLNYAGVETNLEILDEPTQHLSGEGTRDLCEYLGIRSAGRDKQTWLVDHAAIESGHFASTVKVIKGKKGSRIVQ